MYRLIYFLAAFCAGCLGYIANAQTSAQNIPQTLTQQASAVIRSDHQRLVVQSKSKAVFNRQLTVTVLNAKGDKYAQLAVHYDKLQQAPSIKGTLYDAAGNVVRKLKNSDIRDQSAIPDFALFSDGRVKVADLSHAQYPYTVSFEMTQEKEGGIFMHRVWAPQPGLDVSVEDARMEILTPQTLDFRYREKNLASTASVSTEQGMKRLFWHITGITAIKHERYWPQDYTPQPYVLFAANEFQVAGISGDMRSWQSYGNYQRVLNEGKQDLSPTTREAVRKLVADCPDRLCKIRRVYEYLQKNTRYIYIGLGIGGWQPYPASYVEQKSYGDCKALSNYMCALLEAIDIPAYYALVGAGDDNLPVDESFVADYFNHIIVCIPNERDTLWLECTSQSESFGYLGSFTGNRKALAITPEGGKLLPTTTYPMEANRQRRTADVYLDESGNARAEVTTTYTGLQQDLYSQLAELGAQKQQSWLQENLSLPDFQLESFSFDRKKDLVPAVTEKLKLQLKQYASKSSKRFFLVPNLLSVVNAPAGSAEERKGPVQLSAFAYWDEDEIRYHLPVGYYLENKPQEVHIQSAFGEYRTQVIAEEGVLIYRRSLRVNNEVFPAASYEQLMNFLRQVAKTDKMKLVLVNNT